MREEERGSSWVRRPVVVVIDGGDVAVSIFKLSLRNPPNPSRGCGF
jgi:hypothetical protein